MTKRATTYARVSSDDRSKDGLNLAGQLEMCRSYANKKGYAVIAELSEDLRGVSGASLTSPALQQALGMARNHEFDVLVVRELDRFARSLAKQLMIENEFNKLGVELEFVLEEYALTPEGSLHKNIKAVIAEYERVKINERTVRGRHQMVKTGNVLVHGRPPYGYRLRRQNGKSQLVIHEPEARMVRMIFEFYVFGDDDHPPLSSRAIAEKLCEMSIPGPRNGKSKKDEWSQITLQHILRSETYAGIWHYGKYSNRGGHRLPHPEHKWIPVDVPAIISRDIWGMAEKKRIQNRSQPPRNVRNAYLIQNRVSCPHCNELPRRKRTGYQKSQTPNAFAAERRGIGPARNKKIGARPGGGRHIPRHYYYCLAAHNLSSMNPKCINTSFYRADHTDNTVWLWLKGFLSDPALVRIGVRRFVEHREETTSPLRKRMETIKNLLDLHNEQLQKLANLYIDGTYPRDRLIENKRNLEVKIARLTNEFTLLAEQLRVWSFSNKRTEAMELFIQEISGRLQAADQDFKHRQKIIDFLDVRVALTLKNGKRVVKMTSFIFDEVVLEIEPITTGA